MMNGTSPYKPKAVDVNDRPMIEINPAHAKINMGFYQAGVDAKTDDNNNNEPDLATLATWVEYSVNTGNQDISLNHQTYEHFGIGQLIKKENYRAFKLNSTFERTNKMLDWAHLIPLEHVRGYGYPQACNIQFNYLMAPLTQKGVIEKWNQNNKLIEYLSPLLQNISVIAGPLLNKPLKYIHGYNNELKVTAGGLYRIVLKHMSNGTTRAIANIFDGQGQKVKSGSCDLEKIHMNTATSVAAIELLTGLEFKGLNASEKNQIHHISDMLNNENEIKRYERAREHCGI